MGYNVPERGASQPADSIHAVIVVIVFRTIATGTKIAAASAGIRVVLIVLIVIVVFAAVPTFCAQAQLFFVPACLLVFKFQRFFI